MAIAGAYTHARKQCGARNARYSTTTTFYSTKIYSNDKWQASTAIGSDQQRSTIVDSVKSGRQTSGANDKIASKKFSDVWGRPLGMQGAPSAKRRRGKAQNGAKFRTLKIQQTSMHGLRASKEQIGWLRGPNKRHILVANNIIGLSMPKV